MCRKSDAILKSYINSLEYKRNLLNFIELTPNIIIEDVKSLNGVQWSEPENLDSKIILPAYLGQSFEVDNSQSAVSLNLDESSEAIYWDGINNLTEGSKADYLDPLEDAENHREIEKSDENNQQISEKTKSLTKEKKKYGKRKRGLRVCYICGKQTIMIAEHLLTHRKIGDCKCDTCGKLLRNRIELSVHIQAKHRPQKEKNYKCDLCEYSCETQRYLTVHVNNVHEPNKKFECVICNKRFKATENLRLHQMTHTGENRYKCRLCPEQFKDKEKFKKHKMDEHNIQPDKLFKCDQCNLTFLFNYGLVRHLKSELHQVGGMFECEICSEKFNMKSLFKRHMHLKHQDGNKFAGDPVKCNICNKEFKYAIYLRGHQRIHQSDYKYRCEICDKGFHWRSSWKEHMPKHTGEKFHCNSCDAVFVNYRILRRHIKANHEGVE